MKHIITTAAMAAFCTVAIAKEHPGGKPVQPHTPADMHCMKQPASSTPLAKTTTTWERLVAYSYKKLSNHIVLDTTHYWYSGLRGCLPVAWNTSLYPTVQVPDSVNYHCDSFLYMFGGYTTGAMKYNTAGKVTMASNYDTSGSGTGTLQHLYDNYYTYNTAGNIATDSLVYISYTADYGYYYTYDASNYVIRDSAYDYISAMPSSLTLYTNNASGNPLQLLGFYWNTSSLAWDTSLRTTYQYDSYGHMVKTMSEYYYTGTWTNSYKDSLYYPGSGSKYTYNASYTWNSTTSTWDGTSAGNYHLNGAGQWDTVFLYNWNSATSVFDLSEKDYQTYDSYGNLQYAGGIFYNASTSTFADTAYDLNTFYYETYTNSPASVAITGVSGIYLYPNPVSNTLTLRLDDAVALNGSILSLCDILGRPVYKLQLGKASLEQIDMAGIPQGVYVAAIHNTKGELIFNSKVVKQ